MAKREQLVAATDGKRTYILLVDARGVVQGSWEATRALVGDLGRVFAGVDAVSTWIGGGNGVDRVSDYGNVIAEVSQGRVVVWRKAEWKRLLGL